MLRFSGVLCLQIRKWLVITDYNPAAYLLKVQSRLLLSGQGDVPHWGVGSHRSPVTECKRGQRLAAQWRDGESDRRAACAGCVMVTYCRGASYAWEERLKVASLGLSLTNMRERGLSLYWVWRKKALLNDVNAALIQEAPNQLKPQHWAVLKKKRKKEMREKEQTRRFWSSFKAVSSLSPVRLDPTADWLILLIEKRHDCQTLLHHS